MDALFAIIGLLALAIIGAYETAHCRHKRDNFHDDRSPE